ncbi:hypothetical protein CRG98_040934 [Punica granatum]|uniref:Uncharacterized protein n=1 Tax=Punica granatum TaxID=22663 RepID=A0A2I0I5H9_PUNGR|nr:hypothetical protein CRG98_040934 [Punica granatum]
MEITVLHCHTILLSLAFLGITIGCSGTNRQLHDFGVSAHNPELKQSRSFYPNEDNTLSQQSLPLY